MSKKRRILFVCMQNSPHAVRWINTLADRGWDLHVFPIKADPALPWLREATVHPPYRLLTRAQLRGALRKPPWRWWRALTVTPPNPLRPPDAPIVPVPVPHRLARSLERRQAAADALKGNGLPQAPGLLRYLIRRLKPDLIHAMEFQHSAYTVLAARERYGRGFPAWLATNWGSDIYYYRRFDNHRRRLAQLLREVDFYSCECERDIGLAREFGMTAHVLPVIPNAGGFDLEWVGSIRAQVPPSRRRLIMVKGYQHFAGRALTALAALEQAADVVRDFEIVIFSPSAETCARADALREGGILPHLTVVPYADHKQILRLQAQARVYLGVSISDAISTSALEAMAMGAFPIQTNTSCCDEWFEDGAGGFLIPPDDVTAIAARLRTALTDDVLVDRGAMLNWQVVQERLDQRLIEGRIVAFYDEIFAKLDATKRAQ